MLTKVLIAWYVFLNWRSGPQFLSKYLYLCLIFKSVLKEWVNESFINPIVRTCNNKNMERHPHLVMRMNSAAAKALIIFSILLLTHSYIRCLFCYNIWSKINLSGFFRKKDPWTRIQILKLAKEHVIKSLSSKSQNLKFLLFCFHRWRLLQMWITKISSSI